MRITTRGIAKCGVLACLIYVMWYKWVFGEKILFLYISAAIAVGCMLLGLFIDNVPLSEIFPSVCVNDVAMCCYSLVVGCFLAASQRVLISTTFTYLAFSFVCLAACYASWKRGFDWLLIGFICIAFLCAIWTLTNGYYRIGYGLVLSSTNNPHTLGFAMVLGLFAVAYRRKGTTKNFVFNILLATLFLYVIVQCGSRKCLLAAAFIIIPWLWMELLHVYKYGTSIQKMIFSILVLMIIIGLVYYFGNMYLGTDSYDRMQNIEESEANRKRWFYFGLGFKFLLDSPLFGIGLGQFAILNPSATYSHSLIPEALASWGIVGSLLYFIPIILLSYRVFHLARLKRDKESIMVASLCAMEIFMAFLQIYFYSLEHMISWMIIAVFVNLNAPNKCSINLEEDICLN